MDAVREYMQNARHCGELTAKISGAEYKRTLEAMANYWARLAADQRALVRRGERAAPCRADMLNEASQ
jgi:hypothetical protein